MGVIVPLGSGLLPDNAVSEAGSGRDRHQAKVLARPTRALGTSGHLDRQRLATDRGRILIYKKLLATINAI